MELIEFFLYIAPERLLTPFHSNDGTGKEMTIVIMPGFM